MAVIYHTVFVEFYLAGLMWCAVGIVAELHNVEEHDPFLGVGSTRPTELR